MDWSAYFHIFVYRWMVLLFFFLGGITYVPWLLYAHWCSVSAESELAKLPHFGWQVASDAFGDAMETGTDTTMKCKELKHQIKCNGKAPRPQHTRENQRIYLIFNTTPSCSHSCHRCVLFVDNITTQADEYTEYACTVCAIFKYHRIHLRQSSSFIRNVGIDIGIEPRRGKCREQKPSKERMSRQRRRE